MLRTRVCLYVPHAPLVRQLLELIVLRKMIVLPPPALPAASLASTSQAMRTTKLHVHLVRQVNSVTQDLPLNVFLAQLILTPRLLEAIIVHVVPMVMTQRIRLARVHVRKKLQSVWLANTYVIQGVVRAPLVHIALWARCQSVTNANLVLTSPKPAKTSA